MRRVAIAILPSPIAPERIFKMESPKVRSPAGLCEDCRHVEAVTTSRGVSFFLCRLSFEDSRFPKYPTLPVRICSGYAPRQPSET
jgi:hypothetical protein